MGSGTVEWRPARDAQKGRLFVRLQSVVAGAWGVIAIIYTFTSDRWANWFSVGFAVLAAGMACVVISILRAGIRGDADALRLNGGGRWRRVPWSEIDVVDIDLAKGSVTVTRSENPPLRVKGTVIGWMDADPEAREGFVTALHEQSRSHNACVTVGGLPPETS